MFAQPTRRRLMYFISAAILLTFVGLVIAPAAFAKVNATTIDPLASVNVDSRRIIVTGAITCTDGEKAYVKVTLTQRSKGGVAEGQSRISCQGEDQDQHWEVRASIHGEERFDEGPATAVVLARTTSSGKVTDAHQELVNITLVGN